MPKKPDPDAILNIIGAFATKAADVKPGTYDLGDVEVTFRLPRICSVNRAEGTAGGGWNQGKPKPLELTLDDALAVLECLKRTYNFTPAVMQELWAEAIRQRSRGHRMIAPPESVKALRKVEKEIPPEADNVKTPAKNTGTDEITFKFKRGKRHERLLQRGGKA